MDRLETLRSLVSRVQPGGDPFPLYGLAMEYKTRGRLADAAAAFEQLMTGFPDYVATYLMAGQNQSALGYPDQAADIYRKGIEVATRRGDQHARAELETALHEIPSP